MTEVTRVLQPSAVRLVSGRIRLGDFITLTKPRVMALAVFTALVGLLIAPGTIDPVGASLAVLAIAAGAAAAGVLNMWYDADIDAVMSRTAGRPIPQGTVARSEALLFGLLLAGGAIAALSLATNLLAAGLLACTIAFYVLVYTAWLKRRTPQNIVIGGAAGALPPVIGWAAVTGDIGLEPLALFLIIFLWTPPHFWSLSLNLGDDYARAGVPMLPDVAGKKATARQILLYCSILVPSSLLPPLMGFGGPIYAGGALACGAMMLRLALRLWKSNGSDARAARRLFLFSISYLFLLFAGLLADADRLSTSISSPAVSANYTANSIQEGG